MFGALLWVVAIVALADTLTDGPASALGRLAVALVIVGATMHACTARCMGPSCRASRVTGDGRRGDADGAGSQCGDDAPDARGRLGGHDHPLPRRAVHPGRAGGDRELALPRLVGWIGAIGGAGSVVVGIGMFFGMAAGLAVPFAIVISVFMVVLGWLLWQEAAEAPQAERRAAAGREEPRPM